MPQQSSLFNLTQDLGDDISEMHSSSVASDLDLAMDESMKANVPSCEMPETDMVGKSVFIGWSMMPRLFEIWDFDESGYIDRDELLFGVNEYCVRNNVTVPNKVLIEMMDEVDTNHDHQLDIHEFSVFLHKFVDFVGCPLDDATYFLLEILDSQRSAGKLACSKKTNFLSLVHLMKNAFKTPLRKSVSSVSTTGTTTSEGSAGELEDALLEDFRHVRTRQQGLCKCLCNDTESRNKCTHMNNGSPHSSTFTGKKKKETEKSHATCQDEVRQDTGIQF
jgi:hypothetical protein